MAKDERAKSQAEENVSETDKGLVPVQVNGATSWVPESQLNKGQKQEVANQANKGPNPIPNTPTEPAAKPDNPYEDLANAQASQYLAMTKALDPLTSGAAMPAITQNMSAEAVSMLGQSTGGPVAQWLEQQNKSAQAQNQGVSAAMGQLGQAEDANSQLIAGGLKGLGTAESDQMHAAPYQQLLSSLAASVPYHLSSGYSIPGLTSANQPTWLTQAEQNAGISVPGASAGTTPAAKGLLPAPTQTSTAAPAAPSSSPAPQGG